MRRPDDRRYGLAWTPAVGQRAESAGDAPPPATERLEQRGGVAQARRLRLHSRDDCLLIGLLGGENREAVGIARIELRLGRLQRDSRARDVAGWRA